MFQIKHIKKRTPTSPTIITLFFCYSSQTPRVPLTGTNRIICRGGGTFGQPEEDDKIEFKG